MVGEGREVGSLSASIAGEVSVTRHGVVEGTDVHDIILDTGCSRTLIPQDLVPADKRIAGEAVTLRCAHGDTVLYPLADVNVSVGGVAFVVRAALSETLPVSVLLGTDVPQLGRLLSINPLTVHTDDIGEAMVVTRAQAQESERVETEQQRRQEESSVHPTPLVDYSIPTRHHPYFRGTSS